MNYTWAEVDQLTEILEAEAAGEMIDTGKACDLAQRLAELCPEIACSMRQIITRSQM